MQKITKLLVCVIMMMSLAGILSIQTSIAADPVLSAPYPSGIDATYNPRLSVQVTDGDGDDLTVIFKTNASGAWVTLGEYYGGNGVYAQNTTGMMNNDTTYYWSVHVSDGTSWTNSTYDFVAHPFVLKWYHNTDAYTSISPLAVDVNNDGIYEIFSTGVNNITCLYGNNGTQKWRYYHPSIQNHSAFEIADLNNDGTPEIVISGDITFYGGGKTIALHADTGALYWIANAESAQKYLCIADIDGTGYPYVYVCSGDPNEGTEGDGRLTKLRGTDGAVLASTYVWRPCWGGPSIADADHDGKFELYLTDRRANYTTWIDGNLSGGQLGLGMQCYDPETFELLWYQDVLTCSSHMIALVDVNNDGVLDAIALNQASHSGIYTVDGATWDKMDTKWSQSISELYGSHSQPALGDCDGDGRLEIIISKYGPTVVWDIGRWDVDAVLPQSQEPPIIADVYGDADYEIIAGSYLGSPIQVFDGSTYALLENITPGGIAHFCVQDIDNDWQNELVTISSGGIIRTYDTSAYTPTQRIRTNNQYFSERRTSTAEYIPIPGAPQPIIKTVSPAHDAQDVSLNPTLRARIVDYHYDLMNITISTNATGNWTTLQTYSNVGNGWRNVSTANMNIRNHTYYWRVSAFDPAGDGQWTNKTFKFTTLASPEISDITTMPLQQMPGSNVNISCDILDGTTVNTVKINVMNPSNVSTNYSASGGSASWTVLTYDDFESGWGNYTDGGSYCDRVSTSYSYEGARSARIQHYLGLDSSFYLTTPIDVDTPRYTKIKVDFWFNATGMGNLTNFWVKYYDGQHWHIVDNFIKPGSLGYRPEDKPFYNENFTHGITWINETAYNFSKTMKIRFECDAPSSSNTVYIDRVYINATKAQGPEYYLNRTYFQLGTYHYFIWANDNSGNTIKTATYDFTITGNPQPYVPGNPSPSNGSTGVGLAADLSWTGGDPNPEDNVTYDVYFGTSSTPPKVTSNQTALSYNPTLSYSTTYYWRIIAWDSENVTTQGPLWHFKTGSAPGGGGGTYTPPPEPESQSPIADASAGEPYQARANSPITFNGSKSLDPDGNITKWSWTFGDGINGSGKTIAHTYTKDGTYQVTLTVTDNDGKTHADQTTATVLPENHQPTPPVITGTISGQKNTMYGYTITSFDPDNDTIQYTIRWGDQTSYENTSTFVLSGTPYTVNHQWTTAGIYTIYAKAYDNDKTSQPAYLTVLIDVKYTGTLGYLINQDADDDYETFYSNSTGNETTVQKQADGTYLIDSNGDGEWDQSYNPATSGITEYKKTPGFELVVLLCAIIGTLILRRKKRTW